jgi:hypothetical protein
MHSGLAKNAYRFSWVMLFGQFVLAISVIAADLLHARYGVLAGDDWAFYTWPLGLVAGWIFGNRSLTWRRFHIFCVVAGSVLTPILVVLAVRYHLKAEALRGTGFLAGLGEAITAFCCLYLGVAALFLFVSGSATTVHGWRFSLRTLLIGMTLVAITLGAIACTAG